MNIPFSHFGSQGETIHFAHANAYPPECYDAFLKEISDNHLIKAIHHRPLWPESNPLLLRSWHQFSDDLITFFDQQNIRNVHGLGHSLGAVASLIAASKKHGLFKSLFLIDPVLFGKLPFSLLPFLPISIKKRFIPIAQLALKRTDSWADEEELFMSYRSKKIFSRYSDQAIRDFFRGGTVKKSDGKYHLRYSKEWEAQTYATATYVMDLFKKVSVPITIVRASETNVISEKNWSILKSNYSNIHCIDFEDASHLLPFEYPKQLAELFQQHISKSD